MQYSSGVEYGLHAMLQLAMLPSGAWSSVATMTTFQPMPPALMSKIFTQLQSAGLVMAREGVSGGYALARRPEDISVLDIVDAIDGRKPMFQCRAVREKCVLFAEGTPGWASRGVCTIHAVMLTAEKQARNALAECSLAEIAEKSAVKVPKPFLAQATGWFAERSAPAGSESRKSTPERRRTTSATSKPARLKSSRQRRVK
jgi:Rrf2 family protein